MSYRRYNPVEKLINRVFDKKSMVSEELLESKIRSFSKPTTSYMMLLIASIIIATLGLLMNAAAIVIGSMIISPLTWPLFGLADGAALGNHRRIRANIGLLAGSILLGGGIAYGLTVLSPIKVVNDEILARSSPTLLDAIVALTAGAIGSLAIVRKNISDSVAGVAVALSLTPPLCVVGISLALGDVDLVKGSLLLLATNGLSITLVAGVMFILIHYSWRRKLRMAPQAFAIMALSLLITAIPLYRLLNNYSLETASYAVVQDRLSQFAAQTSPNTSVSNISASLEEQDGESVLRVEADIFVPPDVNITLQDKESLASSLEAELGRLVDLRLKLQTISLLANANDLSTRDAVKQIEQDISQEISLLDQALKLNDLRAELRNDAWVIDAQLTGPQSSLPNNSEVQAIEQRLSNQLDASVQLSISLLPILDSLVAGQDLTSRLHSDIEALLANQLPAARLTNVSIYNNLVTLSVSLPPDTTIEQPLADRIRTAATNQLGGSPIISVQTTTYQEQIF